MSRRRIGEDDVQEVAFRIELQFQPLHPPRYGGEVTKASLAALRQWRSRERATWMESPKW